MTIDIEITAKKCYDAYRDQRINHEEDGADPYEVGLPDWNDLPDYKRDRFRAAARAAYAAIAKQIMQIANEP